MTDGIHALLPALEETADAMAWAEALAEVAKANPELTATDAGWMVGWFANYAAAVERSLRPVQHLPASGPIDSAPEAVKAAGSLHEAVFLALGAASTCWESLEGTGVFQSDRAQTIGEALMGRIAQEMEPTPDMPEVKRFEDAVNSQVLRDRAAAVTRPSPDGSERS